MWQFNWGVFWAVLVALVIANKIAKITSFFLPWNVTLADDDSRAIENIAERLESIESSLKRGDNDKGWPGDC